MRLRRLILAAVLATLMLIPIRPAASPQPMQPQPPTPTVRRVPSGWLLHGDRVLIVDPQHRTPPQQQQADQPR